MFEIYPVEDRGRPKPLGEWRWYQDSNGDIDLFNATGRLCAFVRPVDGVWLAYAGFSFSNITFPTRDEAMAYLLTVSRLGAEPGEV